MDKWQLIQLHDSGKMPDWAFYQQIDKYGIEMPLEMRLEQQKKKMFDELNRRKQEQAQIEFDRDFEAAVEEAVIKTLEKNLFS